jgi:peroxiredoxin family protein
MHTEDTMKKLLNPRIQIAPVGFEVDRIVIPAVEYKADVVYLVMHSNINEDKANVFADKITAQLKKKRIKVIPAYANRFDMFEIIKVIKEIIVENRKSEFLINVASGSKIHAIACMLAISIFDDRENLTPFYAIPKKYHTFEKSEQQTYGVADVHELPTYRIKTPDKELLEALTVLKQLIEKSPTKKVTKKDLAKALEEEKIIRVGGEIDDNTSLPKNHHMSKYTTLDKRIVKPLKDWNYIGEEKVGKNRKIFFTDDGEAASKFLF